MGISLKEAEEDSCAETVPTFKLTLEALPRGSVLIKFHLLQSEACGEFVLHLR